MKISSTQLRKIIREEIEKITEAETFPSGDPRSGPRKALLIKIQSKAERLQKDDPNISGRFEAIVTVEIKTVKSGGEEKQISIISNVEIDESTQISNDAAQKIANYMKATYRWNNVEELPSGTYKISTAIY